MSEKYFRLKKLLGKRKPLKIPSIPDLRRGGRELVEGTVRVSQHISEKYKLKGQGFTVLRFLSNETLYNTSGVLAVIEEYCFPK